MILVSPQVRADNRLFSVCQHQLLDAPSGCSEPDIQLGPVMQRFQDHLNAARGLVTDGRLQRPVTSEDIAKAVKHLLFAEQCAELAGQKARTTLMPEAAKKLEPEAREIYLTKYEAAYLGNNGLVNLLRAYRSQIETLPKENLSPQDFQPLTDTEMKIDTYYTQAHRQFIR